jgi:putative ABC transport system permease protein
MDNFLKDAKHSIRRFLQNPGFTIAAVAALALGIGANTAVFSVINTVLLKPLSYPNPERSVRTTWDRMRCALWPTPSL